MSTHLRDEPLRVVAADEGVDGIAERIVEARPEVDDRVDERVCPLAATTDRLVPRAASYRSVQSQMPDQWGPPPSSGGPHLLDQQKTETKNAASVGVPALFRVKTRRPAGIATRWPTVISPAKRPVVGPPSVAWYAQAVTSWLKITW